MANENTIGLNAKLDMSGFTPNAKTYGSMVKGMVAATQNAASAVSGSQKSLSTFGSAAAAAGGKLSSLGSALAKIGQPVTRLSSGFLSLAGNIAKVGAAGTAGGLLALGAGLAAGATAGLALNNTMEQATAKINAFTKDGELTAQILENVRQEAAKTPFEFDQMANSVSGLLPAAKQADVGIMDLLKDAEVLAASNPAEGLDGAAFALREAVSGDFTSVIERFNLPRQMINELKEQGLPNLEIVRQAMKAMGYDTDLVSKMAETASGRWSTFKDNLTNLASIVTQPIFDAFSSGLGGVNDLFTQVSPQLEAFANMLAGNVSGAIAGTTKLFRNLAKVYKGVSGIFSGGKGMVDIYAGLRNIGLPPDLANQITNITKKIGDAFSESGVRGAAGTILEMFGLDPATISTIFTTIDSLATKFGILRDVYQQFGMQGAAVSLLDMMGLDSETIGTITTTIDSVITEVTRLKDAFMGGMEEGGIGGGFSAVFESLKTSLSTMLPTLAGEIMTNIPVVLTSLTTGIAEFLQNNTPQWQDALASWATTFWGWTNTAIAGAGAALAGLLLSLTAWATSPEAGTALTSMGEGLGRSLVTGIGILFDNLPELAAVMGKLSLGLTAAALTLATDLALVGGQVVAGIISGILESLGVDLQPATVAEMSGILSGIGDNIATIASELGKRIVASIKAGWDSSWATISGLGDNFKKIWEDAKTEIGGVIEGLSSFVDDTLEPLEQGLNSVTEAIKTATGYFSSLADAVAGFTIPEVLQMHSPPPLAQSFSLIASSAGEAQTAISNFLAGLSGSQASQAQSTALSILSGFRFESLFGRNMGEDAARTAKDALKDVFFSSIGAILSGSLGEEQFVNQVITRIGGAIGSSVEAVRVTLGSRVDDLFRAVREQLGNASGQLTQQFAQMASSSANLGVGFADMVKTQIEAGEKSRAESKKMAEENQALTGKLEDQGEKLTTLKEGLLALTTAQNKDTEAIKAKQEAIAKLTAEMEANQQTIAENKAALAAHQKELEAKAFKIFDTDATGQELLAGKQSMIELLQNFLAGTGEEFRLAGEGAGIDAVMWSRVKAQQKLNELLEEQRQEEERIAALKKAQENIAYLQQQMQMVQMMEQLGMATPAGMTLGLNADPADLANLMNGIVQAMVSQLNQSVAGMSAHAGLGLRRGLGFARGTFGFRVPGGYPNDSYGPIWMESGETLAVAPRGVSLEGLMMQSMMRNGRGYYGSGGGDRTVQISIGQVIVTNRQDADMLVKRIKREVAAEMG